MKSKLYEELKIIQMAQNEKCYRTFFIKKRNGGYRVIEAPIASLKEAQQKILLYLLEPLPSHEAALGFIKGKSPKDNAERHLGARIILNMDIKDFFPSIKKMLVREVLQKYFTQNEIETILSLVCYKGRLPQGSPCSPYISNLVCKQLDCELNRLAIDNKLIYTRYADDLTFSSKDIEFKMKNLISLVEAVCNKHGFRMNRAKTRIAKPGKRMAVTGICINTERLTISRRYRRLLRAILHNHKNDRITKHSPEQAQGMLAWVNHVM